MFNISIVSFFERLFFKPNILDWVFISLLSPLSILFGLSMFLRRVLSPKKNYTIPIISIGNLTVGGSGKTPFVIQLASKYSDSFIISRGYGRESRGLIEVSSRGKILTDVFSSGDEPMLMAKSLPNASVIVSEDREIAINLAIEQGAKVIFLDDGFNRVNIKKFDILLFPQNIKNFMPFPAGPFREFIFTKYFANLNVVENRDFRRVVTIQNPTTRMLLVTAISNPKRLEPFLPDNIVDRIYFKDHAYFDEAELKEKMNLSNATSILVTQKDEVKMSSFKLPLSVMKLELQIKNEILEKIDKYIGEY
ncbi:Tetraacyldisaccharide 4'-kinase [hydrothermal vent metagenome]|uniref:tetraacyldisaccharide 4'-kinase n=1 Tax=hydrothermal vent metagenome TaxID=652676 RepID=A0A1W1CFX3_9ZZZZ